MLQENRECVYIFSNSHSEKLIKVGRTDKHPSIRLDQLNRQTGTIGLYKLEWSKQVPDGILAERILHFIFKPYHDNKEYYSLSVDNAKIIADEILEDFFNGFKTKYSSQITLIKKEIESIDFLLSLDSDSTALISEKAKLKLQLDILEKLTLGT